MHQIDVILALNEPNPALSDTIASVRSQNLRGWRLLVMTNPSIEGVHSATGQDASHDERIEILTDSGRTVAAMRNKGLDHAEAPFVAFLEPGDTLTPSALSDLIAAAKAGRFGAACGSWLVADANGTPDGPPMDPPEGSLGFAEMPALLTIPASGTVVQRSLLEDKRFGVNLATASHTDMWLRLCEDGVRWQVVPSTVATVRHDTERGGEAERARLEELRSVIDRSFKRASARGWEVEVLDESSEAAIVREAIFTEATRIALAGRSVDPKGAADMFAPLGVERFLTPVTLAHATAVALRFSPAHRAVIDGRTEQGWTTAVHGWWSRCVTQKWIARHQLDDAIRALAEELVDPRGVARDLLASFGSPGRLWVGGTDRTARAVIGEALDAGWRVLVIPGSASGGVNTRLMALPSRVMVAAGDEGIGGTDPLVIGAASEAELLERYGSRANVARWNGAWRRAFDLAARRLESAWPRREL
jgi:hypothetical protein